ncbi:MAG: 5-oxoprolinase subunit PxpB [Anaerolineae bacterium]|nr:5-oxoprolinase subunit PxpB [Anaerolineae bacterium]
MSEYSIVHIGDTALLVEFGEGDILAANRRVLALHRALADQRPVGLLDLIPAYRTLLIVFDPLHWLPATALDDVRRWASHVDEGGPLAGQLVEIPVRYGGEEGPDLANVARHTGLSQAEVVARHAAVEYLVLFIGFMPGFPYLWGLDPSLTTPRLATPRRQVPAGSVGIGGDQTGVYPTASPGGWRLIGRTTQTLYNPAVDPPTLLRAGDRVRFLPL